MPAPHDSTTWSIVLGTAQGQADAQARFHARYESLIRAYLAARWRVDLQHERVANATQEVMLRCLAPDGALSRVDRSRPSGFRAYLLGVTTNVAREVERQDRRHQGERLDGSGASIDPTDAACSAATSIDRAQAAEILREAWGIVAEWLLRKRSGQLRLDVLRLRYLEDLSSSEIRERLGLPYLRDVHRILATGRYQFRRALLHAVARRFPELTPPEVVARCEHIVAAL